MNRRIVVAALMAVSATLAGCRKKPVVLDPVPLTPSTTGGTNAADLERAARERAMRDSLARLRADSAARAASEAEAASLRAILEAPVLFDYDAAEVTEAGRMALDAKLPILRSNPGIRIRVSGHTDSRGSDEYNLALGLRRAAAARKYLSDRGIAVARIDVVSFGEERPASAGEDEGAFSRNRRGEFEILSGGDAMKVPR
jgi:peptidoglycan-associated lipoprotein